jgi:hypothetical protein
MVGRLIASGREGFDFRSRMTWVQGLPCPSFGATVGAKDCVPRFTLNATAIAKTTNAIANNLGRFILDLLKLSCARSVLQNEVKCIK